MSDVLVPKALLRSPETFGGMPIGDCLRGAPVVHNGRLIALGQATRGVTGVVMPPLAEAHCHLDKCHTIERLGTVGGDLLQAIAAQLKDKENWSDTDIWDRAARGLSEARAAGCTALRTHIDWGDDPQMPNAWRLITDLASNIDITMQCAALTGIDQMADGAFAQAVASQVARDKGVLGSFILGHEHTQEGLGRCFAMADRFGLALDFHVDEGLGSFNGLEAIADAARVSRFEGPILCGHAVSLMNRAPEDFKRIADKLAAANISICALPTTNLYLQGRTGGTPDRRGITRLRELQEAGVRIVIGSDNVGDAFCPTGAHDPMQALYIGSLSGHLDPPMGRWLTTITTNARAAMGLPESYIDDLPISDLRLYPVSTLADLVAGRAPFTPFQDKVNA